MPDCEVKETNNIPGQGAWPPGGGGTTSTTTPGLPVIPSGGNAPGGSGCQCTEDPFLVDLDGEVLDTILRNGENAYQVIGVCCGEMIWEVSADAGSELGGSEITQAGVLTAGATSCGSLKVTATCENCGTSATQYVRVTDAGQWVFIDQTPPPSDCKVGTQECGSGTYTIISGKYKHVYLGTQCHGSSTLCGLVPGNLCECSSPLVTIWTYINNYQWCCNAGCT